MTTRTRANRSPELPERRIQVGLIDIRGLSRADRLIILIYRVPRRSHISRSEASPTAHDDNFQETDSGAPIWDLI